MNNTNNSIVTHEGHRQRMKKRFLRTGFEAFEPHQILEMILFYTCPRKDTNEMAHMLINKFGNIANVFEADINQLTSVNGITENTAILFKIITNSVSVYYDTKSRSMVYDSSSKLKNLFAPCFIGLSQEQFRVACFDNNLRLIENKVLFTGNVSYSYVSTRTVVEFILGCHSSLVVFAHNHPKSEPTPSPQDVRTTRMINEVLKGLGIKLIDHIIVGEVSQVSMRDTAVLNIFD